MVLCRKGVVLCRKGVVLQVRSQKKMGGWAGGEAEEGSTVAGRQAPVRRGVGVRDQEGLGAMSRSCWAPVPQARAGARARVRGSAPGPE